MPEIDLHARALALQDRIAALPAGSIAMKKVNGKTYAYHRWTENKKRYDKYVPADQVDTLRTQIEERKALEEELRMVKLGESASKSSPLSSASTEQIEPGFSVPAEPLPVRAKISVTFVTNVLVGEALRPFAAAVRNCPRRAGVDAIESYLRAPADERVFVLTGLRSTGRTTMIRQALANMNPIELARTAYIQAAIGMSMDDLTRDLRSLAEIGVKYVFINDATVFEDFSDRASILADFFTSAGMRIVLSSADPLVMALVVKKRLYHRATLLSTTFLPYREALSIAGYQGVDEFLQFGGTTLPETFLDDRSAAAYLDEAVIGSILRARTQSEVEQLLGDIAPAETVHILREADDFLNKRFLSITLKRSPLPPQNATSEELLEYFVIDVLHQALEPSATLEGKVAHPLAPCFQELGLLREIHNVEVTEKISAHTVCLFPGLRYAGVAALVRTLLASTRFRVLPLSTRSAIEKRLLGRVRTQLLEDLVLLETEEALKPQTVTRVELPGNRCGMVVADPQTLSCTFFLFDFESSNQVERTYAVDPAILSMIEHRFGTLHACHILTRDSKDEASEKAQKVGELEAAEEAPSISRKSVETYLRELHNA